MAKIAAVIITDEGEHKVRFQVLPMKGETITILRGKKKAPLQFEVISFRHVLKGKTQTVYIKAKALPSSEPTNSLPSGDDRYSGAVAGDGPLQDMAKEKVGKPR